LTHSVYACACRHTGTLWVAETGRENYSVGGGVVRRDAGAFSLCKSDTQPLFSRRLNDDGAVPDGYDATWTEKQVPRPQSASFTVSGPPASRCPGPRARARHRPTTATARSAEHEIAAGYKTTTDGCGHPWQQPVRRRRRADFPRDRCHAASGTCRSRDHR